MHRRIVFCLALILLTQSCLSWAGEKVLQFSSELLMSESQQVLQPDRPFKYADPKHGPALRKLLNPDRANIVLDEYFDGVRKGVMTPDLTAQMKPLLERYGKAFDDHPSEYEQEYLDVLNWLALSIRQRSDLTKIKENSPSTLSAQEQAALASLQKSISGLMSVMVNSMAENLRNKIQAGMFSGAGIQRATDIADRLSATAQNTDSPKPPVVRKVLAAPEIIVHKEAMAYNAMDANQKMIFGERVFRENCAVFHGNDGRGQGMPIFSLINAPSFSDADMAARIVVRGKDAMPSWVALSDDEIAAAINYAHDVFAKQSGELVSPDFVYSHRVAKQ
jgi:mono/diheme cytochrome c family protein